MNIFAVHEDPRIAARMLCDRHISKMCVETAQILCSAYWVLRAEAKADWPEPPYKCIHHTHRAVRWAKASKGNWNWLVEHGRELIREFRRRYGSPHKSMIPMNWARHNMPPDRDWETC